MGKEYSTHHAVARARLRALRLRRVPNHRDVKKHKRWRYVAKQIEEESEYGVACGYTTKLQQIWKSQVD